jgi:hypothetical protein
LAAEHSAWLTEEHFAWLQSGLVRAVEHLTWLKSTRLGYAWLKKAQLGWLQFTWLGRETLDLAGLGLRALGFVGCTALGLASLRWKALGLAAERSAWSAGVHLAWLGLRALGLAAARSAWSQCAWLGCGRGGGGATCSRREASIAAEVHGVDEGAGHTGPAACRPLRLRPCASHGSRRRRAALQTSTRQH